MEIRSLRGYPERVKSYDVPFDVERRSHELRPTPSPSAGKTVHQVWRVRALSSCLLGIEISQRNPVLRELYLPNSFCL